MRSARGGMVKGAQGNVIFCEFGAVCGEAENAADALGTDLVAIKSAIAEIHMVSRDILSANLAVTQYDQENSRLLLDAVGRLDNVAFQSGLLTGNAGRDESRQLERAAADAQRLASAGVAAAYWLRTLVAEQKGRMMSTARTLREIAEQVNALEALMRMCLEQVAAEMPEVEFTN
jgi:hypothetical protein